MDHPFITYQRALGGGVLKGSKMARQIYLDEAGISNPSQEPVLVIAGVIIDPDKHFRELRSYFRDLASDLFPDEDSYRFVFHAKDIWHGHGAFSRENWSLEERMRIMRRLAQVPALFDLPVIYGAIDRESARQALLQKNQDLPEKTIRSFTHVQAFVRSIQCAESWLKESTDGEMASLTVEDVHEVKSALMAIHQGYSDPWTRDEGVFTTDHIDDALSFQKKDQSILLQMADHCAFIIRRHFTGCRHVAPLIQQIAPQVWRGSVGGAVLGQFDLGTETKSTIIPPHRSPPH